MRRATKFRRPIFYFRVKIGLKSSSLSSLLSAVVGDIVALWIWRSIDRVRVRSWKPPADFEANWFCTALLH